MNSVKRVLRRFLSLSLSLILVFVLIPSMAIPTFAASVSGLNDSSIGLESSGDASWSASGTTITGSATGQSGTCNDSAQSGTLTITNTKSIAAQLTFSYTVTLNNGTVSVAGTSVTAAGTYDKEVAAGGSVSIALSSEAKSGSTTSISITNISLVADVQATVTYLAPTNGSYTVDGAAVTSQMTVTKSSANATALVATPASGYRFYGWHNVTDDSFFGYTATFSANFDTNITVEPYFIPATAPVFNVSGKLFTDLNDAITYATSNSKSTIVLVANGTLPSGTYTIPNGKTLLIPMDSNNTIYTTAPEVVYGSHTTPSAYRNLTMASGAKIVIANGAQLSVPSKLSATGTNTTSWNGTPTGAHGRISMNSGSTIEVQSGGALYCYGYISGSGLVDAKSGATVWEAFQFRCWRGGTATSNMRSKTVFPMSQYYCQNIEASLKLEAGATEKVYTSVNASSSAYPTSCTFIGSGGMFIPSGSITKRYDGATDRLIIDIDGNLTMSSMSMSLSVVTLNTADFVLPINSNITININSGTTTVSGQDLAFLPGSIVNIANGATFNVASGSDIYIYDQSEWGAYAAASANLVVVGYSTVNGTTAKRNNNSLIDSKFDVNGTITVSGTLYTTSSGANITSSGKTGRIQYNAAAGTATTTQQVTQSGSSVTYVDIPITSAQLLNGDGTFTQTTGSVSGDLYTYSSRQNKWIKGEDVVNTYTVTFKNASGTTIKTVTVEEGNTVPSAEVPALPSTANNNNGTHTTYDWNASVTSPITADTTFTQVGTTADCSLATTSTTAATCTTAGSTTQTCSVCGYAVTTAIPPLGHSYTSVVTAPTCTAGGYTTYTCSVCGDTYTADATDALGHDLGAWTVTAAAVAPTCTTAGATAVETRTCSRCDYSETRGGEEVAALGHTPAAAVEENRVEPTCDFEGSYDLVVYCSVCGAELSRESYTIPSPPHSWSEWTVTTASVAPTCTETGATAVETRTCTRCGLTQTRGGEEVAALGHTPAAAVEENRVEPTCDFEGSYDLVVYCSVCGAELSRTKEYIAMLGHNYVGVVTEPTCTEGGYTTYTCSVCGDSYIDDATAALGHNWGEWTVVTEPTTTEAGDKVRVCSRCGAEEHEAIPVLPMPETITVSGQIFIAEDAEGTATEYGLRGVVIAALDGEGNVIASTTSNATGASSTWGEYSLEVPVGTTDFVVGDPENADTIVNREFTITGDADVTGADVAVIMCDYNDDGVINSMDKAEFNGYYKGDYSVDADFNDDGIINAMDKAEFNGILKACQGGANYTALSF